MKNFVKTTDLWLVLTDDEATRFSEYDKAFRAGFNADHLNRAITPSYDFYRVYLNCACELICPNYQLPVCPTAIVFYKNGEPIRLLVDTNSAGISACINHAIIQRVGKPSLNNIFEQSGVKSQTVNLKKVKQPDTDKTAKAEDKTSCPQISSCNRWDLFLQFIDNMKTNGTTYHYKPKFSLTCKLTTEHERFQIQHRGAFVDAENHHCITLQKKSAIMP